MTSPPRPTGRRAYRLSHLLALYSFALLIPLFAYAGYVLWRYTSVERTHVEARARDNARNLARDVERELRSIRAVLATLADSVVLDRSDLDTFYDQAAAAAAQIEAPILLVDLDRQQLINTRRPKGAALPRSDQHDIIDTVRRTKLPFISDLVVGAVAQQLVLGIAIPVLRNDEVRYVLMASLEPQRLVRVLTEQDLPAEWILAITDRSGRIVARSTEQAQFVGRAAQVRELSPGIEGVHRIRALTGGMVLRGYSYLANGWMAAAFVPAEFVDRPLREQWLAFAGFGLLVLGLCLPFAFLFGRRLTEPLARIAASTGALEKGEPVPLVRSHVREANSVSEALHAASRRLIENARALTENEVRFRAIFEQAAVGFEEWALDNSRMGVNDRLCAMLGYTREECMATTFRTSTHSDDFAMKEALVGRLFKGEIPSFTQEMRLLKKNGDPLWVRITSSLARDAAGKPSHRISVIEDVTERRRARGAAARLAAIVQFSNDAIFSVSPAGIIETWNQGAEKLLGYSEAEIVGKPYSALALPESQEDVMAEHARACAGEAFSREAMRVHKDGSLVEMQVNLSPIRAADGTLSAISVTMEDIRDRKARERQIALLNRELQHRVKNSLAVVQSIVNQTLRLNPDPDAFRIALEGRLRALAAANDMLLRTEWQGAEIATFVGNQLNPLIADPATRLRLSGPAVTLPAPLSVPLALALHELATNAIKYGALSQRGGAIAVSWRLVSADDRRWLEMTWSESGGPAVQEPRSLGFGSILIERGIPGARVERRFEAGGLVCVMTIPLDVEKG